MRYKMQYLIAIALACVLGAAATALAQASSVVDKGEYKFHSLTSGALQGKVAWAFDTPGNGSDALGLLLQSMGGAQNRLGKL